MMFEEAFAAIQQRSAMMREATKKRKKIYC